MSKVRRIYVEKKAPYAVKAAELKGDLKNYLGLDNVEAVREFIRYDVENISDEIFEKACKTVFSEPPVDDLYEETIEIPANGSVLKFLVNRITYVGKTAVDICVGKAQDFQSLLLEVFSPLKIMRHSRCVVVL